MTLTPFSSVSKSHLFSETILSHSKVLLLYVFSFTHTVCFIFNLSCLLSVPFKYKLRGGRSFCLFCSQLYPWCLEKCLVLSQHLGNESVDEILAVCASHRGRHTLGLPSTPVGPLGGFFTLPSLAPKDISPPLPSGPSLQSHLSARSVGWSRKHR